MTNAELIKALRNCASAEGTCAECSYRSRVYPGTCNGCKWDMMHDAADALEAAEKRIAIVEEERDLERFAAKNYLDKIDELEAQLPKEGEWKDESIDIWGDKREVYRCSVCENMNAWMSRYCPNCGAKMKTVTNCHTLEEGEHDDKN